MVSPQAKRQAVDALRSDHELGVTRACGLVGISRSLHRYRSRRPAPVALTARIAAIAAEKRRYGYRRVYLRLRREGWKVNRKRGYRLYREAGLAVRRRERKRIGLAERRRLPKPAAPNLSWLMDFVSDGLSDGRRPRYRELQRALARRMPERALIHQHGAGPRDHRALAHRVQHRAHAQFPRRSDARGVRGRASQTERKGSIVNRGLKPESVLNRGSRQSPHGL